MTKHCDTREVAKYFSIDWGVVAFGAPVDGPKQLKMLKEIARDYAAADGDHAVADGIERIEKLLGLTLEDAMADVAEIGFAYRPGREGREWLLAAKVKDGARAEFLVKRANMVRPEGRWAASADGEFFLLASGDAVIAEARETAVDDRSILKERTAKQFVADVTQLDGLAFINPMRLATGMPRNPNAPPPALVGVSWFVRQEAVVAIADLSQMKGLVANLARFLK